MSAHASVRPYVRPSTKSSSISMKFGTQVEVDEWCTMVCSMTRSKVKVKVTSPSNLEIPPFSKAISSAINNGSWQLTTDCETRAQYLNFIGPSSVICRLSSSVTLLASGRAGNRARGRSGGRHCTAGQYGNAPLGRHRVLVVNFRRSVVIAEIWRLEVTRG